MLETVGLRDMYDTIGAILTNPIVTFPPGRLSTWKPPPATGIQSYNKYALGEVWINWGAGYEDERTFAPLDVKDLACATWGLGRSTDSNNSVIITIEPPFLPLLIPNTQIFSVDPTWARLYTAIDIDTYEDSRLSKFSTHPRH